MSLLLLTGLADRGALDGHGETRRKLPKLPAFGPMPEWLIGFEVYLDYSLYEAIGFSLEAAVCSGNIVTIVELRLQVHMLDVPCGGTSWNKGAQFHQEINAERIYNAFLGDWWVYCLVLRHGLWLDAGILFLGFLGHFKKKIFVAIVLSVVNFTPSRCAGRSVLLLLG